MTVLTGTRWECSTIGNAAAGFAAFHKSGHGKPRVAYCTYCRSPLNVWTGVWCVLPWRGDGRYQRGDALSEHASPVLADRAMARAYEAARAAHGYGSTETCLVVRFIYVTAPPPDPGTAAPGAR